MVFRKRKERTDRLLNELHLGEFWLMPGAFRAEEATAGMMGSYGLPGGYGALAASAEQEEALRSFHAIVQRTVEEVSAGLPVALTVSDYAGHTCALWEARFPELRQMALEQCRWFKEEEVGKGEKHIFLFDRLPKGLYTSLYQCIHTEIPWADVYLNCSILKKEFPLHFDEGSTPEKSALLNLHVDWGHLVLIIQTAPDFPIKKLAKELADACEMEGRIFSGHTKRL